VAEKSTWDLAKKRTYLAWKIKEKQPNHQDDMCLLFQLYLFFGLMGEYTWHMIFFFQM
jgi:hypothetical protein